MFNKINVAIIGSSICKKNNLYKHIEFYLSLNKRTNLFLNADPYWCKRQVDRINVSDYIDTIFITNKTAGGPSYIRHCCTILFILLLPDIVDKINIEKFDYILLDLTLSTDLILWKLLSIFFVELKKREINTVTIYILKDSRKNRNITTICDILYISYTHHILKVHLVIINSSSGCKKLYATGSTCKINIIEQMFVRNVIFSTLPNQTNGINEIIINVNEYSLL